MQDDVADAQDDVREDIAAAPSQIMAVPPFAAFTLLILTACAGLIALVLLNQSDMKRAAREASERLVAAIMTSVEESARRSVHDYAWWDEVIEKGLLSPDPVWLNANFGNQALENLNLDGIVLLAADDTPVHAHFGSVHHGSDSFAAMLRSLAPLLARTRQGNLKDPNPQLTYLTIAGIPHLVAVAALSPVTLEPTRYTSAARGVMVLIKELDGAWLDHIAVLYDIAALSFVTDDVGDAPRHVLPAPGGEPAGFLAWRQDERGDLSKISWQGGAVLGVFLISAALLFGRLHDMVKTAQRDRRKVARLASQLASTSARLQHILDSVNDGILEMESDGRVTFANRAAGVMTGRGSEHLRGVHVFDLLQSDSFRTAPASIAGDITDLVGVLAQAGSLRKLDGSCLHVDVHVSRSDQVGKATGTQPASLENRAVVVVRDVTDRDRAERVLRESEELYRQMFRANSAIKLLIDPQTGSIVDANPAATEFYGYSAEELCRLRITDINVLPAQTVNDELQRAAVEERQHFLFQHRLKSGEVRDVEIYAGPVNVAGRTLVQSIVFDISEKKEAEKEIWRLNRRLQDAIDSLSEGFTLFDPDDRLILFNNRFLEICASGLDAQSARGMMYEELVRRMVETGTISVPDDQASMVASLVSHHRAATGSARTLRLANGRWIKISERRTQDGGIVGVLSDVSELEEHRQRIEFIAHHDMLTALPNRVLFKERFDQMIAEVDRTDDSLAVLSLDLNGFKAVNDRLGHAAGDQVLREFADILRQNVRGGDVVARLGGDEFVVLMRMSREQASTVARAAAKRLVKEAVVTVQTPSGPLTVSASIGIALYPQNTTDGKQLIPLSDHAMYRAKESGRYEFAFSDPQSIEAGAKLGAGA